MNWLKFLVGFSALIIAGCAAYFSVTGLGVLFAGASVSVMIMASALELAKLVAATYLKQKWDEISGFNKWYITISVAVLMLITSAGIFGYLSNAFQQQNIQLLQIEREISVFDTKIKQNEGEIARYTTQLNNQQNIRNSQESNLSKQIDKNVSTSRVSQMIRTADKEITQISAKINKLTEENNKNYEEINKIKNANIDIEKEVGGFRFVAEAFGVELAQVVKFFIFLIVLVFDPLAVALIIAFNGLIGKKKEEPTYDMGVLDDLMEKNYEIYGDSGKNSTKEEEVPVIVENISENTEDNGKYLTKDEESQDIVENISQTDSSIEDFMWEPYMHPDFPWHKRNLWINNSKAVQYWMNTKGGNYKEYSKIKNEEENTKKY